MHKKGITNSRYISLIHVDAQCNHIRIDRNAQVSSKSLIELLKLSELCKFKLKQSIEHRHQPRHQPLHKTHAQRNFIPKRRGRWEPNSDANKASKRSLEFAFPSTCCSLFRRLEASKPHHSSHIGINILRFFLGSLLFLKLITPPVSIQDKCQVNA